MALEELLSDIKRIGDTKQQAEDLVAAFTAGIEKLSGLKTDVTNKLAQLTEAHAQAIQDLKARMAQLKDGYTPIKGRDYFDGAPGADAVPLDPAEVAKAAADLIKLPQYRAPIMPGPDEIRNMLELLQGSERLKASAIDGLDALQNDIQALKARPLGTMTPSGPVLYVGGTKKGRAQELKLAAGSNMTISHNASTGTVTFASTGGAGATYLTATETPNGNNKVFTFSSASAQPSYIYSDNVRLPATSKAGTVNWTWNNGTKKATMTIPPNDDIEAQV